MLTGALERTAALWPEVEVASEWVKTAVRILNNEDHADGATVKARYQALRDRLSDEAGASPWLGQVVQQFVKVTASYEPHLFHCYDVPDLPRTNNDLEQLFGSVRCHERRTTGHKLASPGLVLRGPVRLPAVVATPVRPFTADDLAPRDIGQWRTLRAALERRHQARVWGYRFRRNPEKYLATLEEQLLQLSLPP
jgi:hypothetical protein